MIQIWHRCCIVALACALLGGCSGTALLNALAPRDSHRRVADLAYGPLPRQAADLYLPRADAPPEGYPLVVFFYGGSWNRGERAQYRFVGEALSARGVVVLVADYRLYPTVRYPEFLTDCAAALAFAYRRLGEWRVDPHRVFVAGHSAGAYNAAMLALDPRWLGGQGLRPDILAGWIGLAGPYDFIPVVNPEVRPVFHFPDTPPDSQPIAHARGGSPAALLAAPTVDPLVDPRRNTGQLAEALERAGVVVVVRAYEGVSHQTLVGAFGRPLRGLAPVLEDVLAFIGATRQRP